MKPFSLSLPRRDFLIHSYECGLTQLNALTVESVFWGVGKTINKFFNRASLNISLYSSLSIRCDDKASNELTSFGSIGRCHFFTCTPNEFFNCNPKNLSMHRTINLFLTIVHNFCDILIHPENIFTLYTQSILCVCHCVGGFMCPFVAKRKSFFFSSFSQVKNENFSR